MPTRDNHSNQIMLVALVGSIINSDTVTNGEIIDTADFDMGIKFGFDIRIYTDGDYAISYEEGDDPALGDATAVPADKIIGDAVSLSAAQVVGDPLPGNGLFSTKRFVRAVVTSTNTSTGATVGAGAVESGEYNPQT